MNRPLLAVLAALLLCARPAAALPVDLSFTGSFTRDDERAWFAFTLEAPGPVTLVTHSYAGGTNAAGTAIPRGGFDPIVAVFDTVGTLLAANDDGDADVPADLVTDARFDSYLVLDLAPGDYIVALAMFDNEPASATDFPRAGQASFSTGFGCTDAQPTFNDVTGLPGCGRTGQWALDIIGADSAVMPEPVTLALLAPALLALGMRRRRP
jgi:hypothetical protein